MRLRFTNLFMASLAMLLLALPVEAQSTEFRQELQGETERQPVCKAPNGELKAPFVGPGAKASTEKHPAAAMLLYDDGRSAAKPLCTATLVAPNAVLTAAHCFCFVGAKTGTHDFHHTARRCRTGHYFRQGQPVRALDPAHHKVFFPHAGFRNIKKILLHRRFAWRGAYPRADLALVILDKPITEFPPVALNTIRRIRPFTALTAVGFGSRNPHTADNVPTTFEEVIFESGFRSVAKVQTGRCRRLGRYSSLICWDYNPANGRSSAASSCQGDSGGPLFWERDKKLYLAGVISAGSGYRLCLPGNQAYNTEVFKFRKWLRANLRAHAKYEPDLAGTQRSKLKTLYSCACHNCKGAKAPYKTPTEKSKVPTFVRYTANCSGIKKKDVVEIALLKAGKATKTCQGTGGTAYECVDTSPENNTQYELVLRTPKGSACNLTVSTVQ